VQLSPPTFFWLSENLLVVGKSSKNAEFEAKE